MADENESETIRLINKLTSERLRKEAVVRRAIKALHEMREIKKQIESLCETKFPELVSRIDKITTMLENIQNK